MDERRRRAWAALELGPLWTVREAAVSAPEAVSSGPAGAPFAAPCEARPASRADGPQAAESVHEAEGGHEAEGVHPEGRDEAIADATHGSGVRGTPEQALVARERAIASMRWEALADSVAGCTACALSGSRRRTVLGVGARPATWMFVGEAPGEQEDARGEPFVGDAGALLDGMLASIGLSRGRDAFIANVLKCRPPGNRDPLPEEVARCEPYLLRQVELVQPRVIVALGRFAARSLLRDDAPIARLRGRVHRLRIGEREIPLVVTYHPAYLLRSLPDKSRSWADLLLARRALGEG